MNRAEFLNTIWVRFPEAKTGWMSVADFKALEDSSRAPVNQVTLAGRLFIETQTSEPSQILFMLNSGGEELLLKPAPGIAWLEPQLSRAPNAAPDLEIFGDGDLVVIEGQRDAAKTLIVTGILLLVPSDRSLELDVSEFNVARSAQWAKYLETIRTHFSRAGFTEATTPTLVPSPGTEPFLEPFSTEWQMGSRTRKLFLPTSPEFHLKQMLARGWTRVFEIKTCFRNGEIGEHHQPEFLMLEWYRAYANLDAIADDVAALIATVAKAFGKSVPALQKVTMPELFAAEFPGFTLSPATTREELAALAEKHAIATAKDDSFDDIFFRLFLEKIESGLGVNGPLLVTHYPPSQAALSRIGAHGFAERFEVYWRGLELANAFHELNDPAENELRFKADAEKKAELKKDAVPRDENLVRALRLGMPPSGGIALGVDRLFMALMEIEKIEDTRAFPLRHS